MLHNKSLLNFEPVANLADQWELYYNGDKNYELLARGVHDQVDVVNNPKYSTFVERRAKILSDHLLNLAQRGAAQARDIALSAGVPVVSVQR